MLLLRKYTYMKENWTLIDSAQKLKSAIEDISSSSLIGLDKEYDSFRYFTEKLCLIQVSTMSRAYIYDPLGNLEFPLLGDIVKDSATTVIMHACGNDVRLLKRDYGFEFNNIFDTHKAASLLGSSALSLPSVIGEYLGVELKKTKKIQRSRWDIRPLSKEQLVYAVQDTSCLIDLYRVMMKRLEKEGLTAHAEKAFSKLASSLWTKKTFDPEGYLNIKGCETLNQLELRRLKALHLWRFEKARQTNMARFMILSHRDMIDLSRGGVLSIDAMEETGTIPHRSIKEFGAEIITVLRGLS